jgi:hypothetical protein
VVVLQSLPLTRDLVIDFPQRWHVQACKFGKHCALMRRGVGLQRAFTASWTTAAVARYALGALTNA